MKKKIDKNSVTKVVGLVVKVTIYLYVAFMSLIGLSFTIIPNVIVAYGRTIGLSKETHLYDAVSIWGFPSLFFTIMCVVLFILFLKYTWISINYVLDNTVFKKVNKK